MVGRNGSLTYERIEGRMYEYRSANGGTYTACSTVVQQGKPDKQGVRKEELDRAQLAIPWRSKGANGNQAYRVNMQNSIEVLRAMDIMTVQ